MSEDQTQTTEQQDKVDQQEQLVEENEWPKVDDFRTWGDYLKAWTRRFIDENRPQRVSTNEIVKMEKEQLIDLIDKLYQENDKAWDAFKTNLYLVADGTASGQSLTSGERKRREQQEQETQKTIKNITNKFYIREKEEDSFWDWINPFKL